MITIRHEDDCARVYDKNKYVGYMDAGVLFMFDEKGYAEECAVVHHTGEISDHVRKYKARVTDRIMKALRE